MQDQEGVLAWVSERLAVAMRQAEDEDNVLDKPTLIVLKARQGNKGQEMYLRCVQCNRDNSFTPLRLIQFYKWVYCEYCAPSMFQPERLNEKDHFVNTNKKVCESLNLANK